MDKTQKRFLIIAAIFLLMGVCIGAFGAHGLKPILSRRAFETYQTGVTYMFYHGLAIMGLSLVSIVTKINLKWALSFLSIGVVFFSFNCILSAITGIKFFGIIVPIGGVLFILGWLTFIVKMIKAKHA